MNARAVVPNLDEINARMIDLETRFAFQDEVIGTLNPQVAVHERVIVDLAAEMRQLRLEVQLLRVALGHDMREEPAPPHY